MLFLKSQPLASLIQICFFLVAMRDISSFSIKNILTFKISSGNQFEIKNQVYFHHFLNLYGSVVDQVPGLFENSSRV